MVEILDQIAEGNVDGHRLSQARQLYNQREITAQNFRSATISGLTAKSQLYGGSSEEILARGTDKARLVISRELRKYEQALGLLSEGKAAWVNNVEIPSD